MRVESSLYYPCPVQNVANRAHTLSAILRAVFVGSVSEETTKCVPSITSLGYHSLTWYHLNFDLWPKSSMSIKATNRGSSLGGIVAFVNCQHLHDYSQALTFPSPVPLPAFHQILSFVWSLKFDSSGTNTFGSGIWWWRCALAGGCHNMTRIYPDRRSSECFGGYPEHRWIFRGAFSSYWSAQARWTVGAVIWWHLNVYVYFSSSVISIEHRSHCCVNELEISIRPPLQ